VSTEQKFKLDLDHFEFKFRTKVTATFRVAIGADALTVELSGEAPDLPPRDLEVRAHVLGQVINRAMTNFVRPPGAPYVSVEKPGDGT
jgi:hypothetical protein